MANSKNKEEFINPFDKGVTYDVFVKTMGRKAVKTYCDGHLSDEQIEWIETEIKNYKNK